MAFTFGELFAGIGGIGLGLERAGMEVRWQVERDPFCRQVLEKHWPDVKRYEDVKDVGGHNLEPVDLIAGGFPCQDLSYAGKGAGLDGERSGLWDEYARIIRELRPQFVLVENVPALLTRGFGRVLGDLAESGYDAEWDCLPASAFGAYHERDRVFLVAYPAGEHGRAWSVLGESRDGRSSLTARRLRGLANATKAARENERLEHEPDVARMVHRIPDRTHRIEAIGNSVHPAVSEYIGHRIMEAIPS